MGFSPIMNEIISYLIKKSLPFFLLATVSISILFLIPVENYCGTFTLLADILSLSHGYELEMRNFNILKFTTTEVM